MNQDHISRFTKQLGAKFLLRSCDIYTIIATPFLRAVMGYNDYEFQFTGAEKFSCRAQDFDIHFEKLQYMTKLAKRDHVKMANDVKSRFLSMQSFSRVPILHMHSSEKHALCINVFHKDTLDMLCRLSVPRAGLPVQIQMLGHHIDLHTEMRVAFNKSGKFK